ncbi:MAG TPA: leader peptide processing enzyme [Treponemataceae bacterium]|nr:leader peptide processing enzyme [Treponemataceae bacterium]
MNKKMNTVAFILVGTLVNVLLAVLFIGSLMFAISLLVPYMGEQVGSLVPFAFVAGIILAMLVYQKLTRWVIEKYDLNDKLDPLFSSKRKRNKKRME